MEIIDINWNPKQQNEKKRVKPPKWPKQNHRNKTNLSTKTKRPIWPKNMQKITVNNDKMNAQGCNMSHLENLKIFHYNDWFRHEFFYLYLQCHRGKSRPNKAQ